MATRSFIGYVTDHKNRGDRMGTPLIRNATLADIKFLVSFMNNLGYPTNEEALWKRFSNFVAHDGYGVAVACVDEIIAGFVAWSQSLLFVSNTTRLHIEGLIVADSYKGLGIGRQLIGRVEEIAKQSSPAIVDLTSGIHREKNGAHEFYKKLGYQNQGVMAKVYLRKNL
jgi:Acetyltransferases